MAGVLPNHGEGDALKYLVNNASPQDLVLKLFKSNTTPAEGDTASTYTEANFTGYASVTLSGASWTITEGAPSQASYAAQTFTSTAGSQSQAVYGYYLVRSSSGRLAWAERFSDGPYTITNLDDAISVTAVITLD